MAGVDEHSRPRWAAVLVLAGAGLILVGLALLIRQIQDLEALAAGGVVAAGPGPAVGAQALQRVLLVTLLLVGVFAVASLAFVRWSRHFRRWLLRRPVPPTPDADVWAMHRLPEEADRDTGGDPDTGGC